MRARLALLRTLVLVVLLPGAIPGCTKTPDAPPAEPAADAAVPADARTPRDLRPGTPPPDASTVPDLLHTGCPGLSECECFTASEAGLCDVIAEPCHCPRPVCGPGTCFCSGGRYLACADRASGCATTVSCRPAGRLSTPDIRGCLDCTYEADCGRAFSRLMDTCKSKSGQVELFSCSANPDCISRCVNEVRTCDDIGCGLCPTCRCPRGSFEDCVAACAL